MTELDAANSGRRPFGRDGNVAILFALLLPVLCLSAGGGIDFYRWRLQQGQLQEFSDTLALRGAREFLLANAEGSEIESLIETIAPNLAANFALDAFEVAAEADEESATVTVETTQPATKALFLSMFGPFKDDVVVRATAVARGGMKVCVVALAESAPGAVALVDAATLSAEPCSILSNSTSSSGISVAGNSTIEAGLICSAGGASGGSSSFKPEATTDCPEYPDPLAERAPPPVGGCDYTNYTIGHLSGLITALPLIRQTLSPGVYCGGLRIAKLADVEFLPGIYTIKDGPLTVGEGSTLEGRNIAFYLVGANATFTFEAAARIAMSAPKTGALAGILFYEDRDAPADRVHAIYSEDAREFLGTFYLPRGILRIDTLRPVADASAYTAIVARKLELAGSPTLVLNADYATTDVPVPGGLGPVGGEVFLRD